MTPTHPLQQALEALRIGVREINMLGGAKQAMPLHEAIASLRAHIEDPKGEIDAAAWMHIEDPSRVISAMQKEGAIKDGGACASSVAGYSIPLVHAHEAASPPAPQPERVALTPLTDEQHLELAKAMAQRLMSWRLPADFTPDCGIGFKRESDYEHPEYGRTTYFPTGTNLFTHEQVVSMLLAILPADIGTQALEVTPEAVALWLRANGYRTEASRIERKHGIAA